MEFGGVTKTLPPSSQNPATRVDQAAASVVTKTEAPPEATVQRIRETAAVRLETTSASRDLAALEQAMQKAVNRRLELDDESRSLVFTARDARSGEVVTQIPTEQTLKLRAYLRGVSEAAQEAGGGSQ